MYIHTKTMNTEPWAQAHREQEQLSNVMRAHSREAPQSAAKCRVTNPAWVVVVIVSDK